jgi:hypothetical protein
VERGREEGRMSQGGCRGVGRACLSPPQLSVLARVAVSPEERCSTTAGVTPCAEQVGKGWGQVEERRWADWAVPQARYKPLGIFCFCFNSKPEREMILWATIVLLKIVELSHIIHLYNLPLPQKVWRQKVFI